MYWYDIITESYECFHIRTAHSVIKRKPEHLLGHQHAHQCHHRSNFKTYLIVESAFEYEYIHSIDLNSLNMFHPAG